MKNALSKCKFLLNNVRGAKTKMAVIKRIIDEEDPVLVALVETKLDKEDKFNISGFIPVRGDRENEGGGVVLFYKERLENIVVKTKKYSNNNCEMIWVKINNN